MKFTVFNATCDVISWDGCNEWHLVIAWAVILLGQEMMTLVIDGIIGKLATRTIPAGGKYLETFGFVDWMFVYINRFSVPIMMYHMYYVMHGANEGHVEWDMDKMTVFNTLGSIAFFFIVYDMVYSLFHRFLHIRGIYRFIHKHHHRQMVPTRGNLDASNTHPIEFIVGEYLHLLSIYLIPHHFVAVIAFMIIGGILASLNHTRYDISIPHFYDVKAHDTHHRFSNTNYGQYIMMWDKVMGTHREYDDKKFKI